MNEQFCIDQIRYLYQTYFDLGLQYQLWPVSFNFFLDLCIGLNLCTLKDDILKIIPSNEANIIQQYLADYLQFSGKKID